MALPPGVAAARRLITIIGAALAVVALVGGVAYASQQTANGCGSGWAAARKPYPKPLLTPAEVEEIKRDKRNPYQAATEKTAPIRACRRAGSKRLVTAGIGTALILLPVAGVLGFLYYPRREDLTEEVIVLDDPDGPLATNGSTRWPGR